MLVFPAAMIFAAMSDLTTMTIPNRVSIALAAAFVLVCPLAGLPLQDIGLHVAAGALMLVIGIVLFAGGILGGGDAKLMAAASLWVGFPLLLQFVMWVALAGGLLAIAILLLRRIPADKLKGPAWLHRLNNKEQGIPYGVAIAVAALIQFPNTTLYTLIIG